MEKCSEENLLSLLKENNKDKLLFYENKLKKSLETPLEEADLIGSFAYREEEFIELPISAKQASSCFLALKSKSDGNCLFSSVSIALFGDDGKSHILRELCSLELFLNAEFYSRHPNLQSAFAKGNTENQKLFSSYNSLLAIALSTFMTSDNACNETLIQNEAVHISQDKVWSSFFCVLALSSVCSVDIRLFYPDKGLIKYKTVFDQLIKPRSYLNSGKNKIIFIYWCSTCGKDEEPNHFLPLIKKYQFRPKKRKIQKNLFDMLPKKSKTTDSESMEQKSPTVNIESKEPGDIDSQSTSCPPQFDVSSFDFSKVSCKEYLMGFIKNCKSPPESMIFPKNSSGRKFNQNWLTRYPWLRYSSIKDGAYCLPCMLFSCNTKMKKLIVEPYNHWNAATQFFNSHESAQNGCHKSSFLKYNNFISVMNNVKESIAAQVNRNYSEKVIKNRKIIYATAECIKFCGRQGIAFRGHSEHSEKDNPGNFIELLKLVSRNGNEVLKGHLKDAAENAKYNSPDIQNQLIDCFGASIREDIIGNVKNSKYFSVLCDEASDCSNKEQLSLVVRYVHSDDLSIREDFIKFVECSSGLSGQALFETLKKTLEELGLDIQDCRGQGYDGAGAMAGCNKGLSALMLKENSMALYAHCASHKLSLCVMKSCKIQQVKNVMEHVKEISYFFNLSVPRNEFLIEMVTKYCPSCLKKKLVDVCRTRWIEQITGMNTFLDLIVAVYHALKGIGDNDMPKKFNRESSAKAEALFNTLARFSFIATFIIVKNIFDLLYSITYHLQYKANDIARTNNLINSLKIKLQDIRENAERYHDTWFQQACTLAEDLNVDVLLQRRCERQTNRANYQTDDASSYYRCAVTVPLLDHLIIELDTRFDENTFLPLSGLYVIPSKMIENKLNWKEKFLKFVKFYSSDMPSNGINAELEHWEAYWGEIQKSEPSKVPKTIGETLRGENVSSFPNIFACLKILGTLPTTTCECERSISALRHLKTWKRSTMTNKRLNGLAALYIHREKDVDCSKIVDKFALIADRRLQLI